jgi:hypothetical protein
MRTRHQQSKVSISQNSGYRDTSLSRSSEKTRTLPKTESWVAAWFEFSFRLTHELLLDVVDEGGGTACSARNGIDERDGLVAM